ncbi:hypothetical protein ABBQ32_000426 [Trebouxia sp. C0010 RCD-2024]
MCYKKLGSGRDNKKNVNDTATTKTPYSTTHAAHIVSDGAMIMHQVSSQVMQSWLMYLLITIRLSRLVYARCDLSDKQNCHYFWRSLLQHAYSLSALRTENSY